MDGRNPLGFNPMMFSFRALAGFSGNNTMHGRNPMQGRRPTPESEQNGEAREVKNLFSETHLMQGAVSGPRKRTKRRTQEGARM